jgi:hypothetical protein
MKSCAMRIRFSANLSGILQAAQSNTTSAEGTRYMLVTCLGSNAVKEITAIALSSLVLVLTP